MKGEKPSFVVVTLLVAQMVLILLIGGIIKALDIQSKRIDRLEVLDLEALIKQPAFQ